MPRLNIYHGAVIRALRDDGWTITHDPYQLAFGGRDLFIDLGAEKPVLAATRGQDLIAVEVQSFTMPSFVRALEEALGQYAVYRALLAEVDPGRKLYMAVPRRVHDQLLVELFGQTIIQRLAVKVMVFDEATEKVLRWVE